MYFSMRPFLLLLICLLCAGLPLAACSSGGTISSTDSMTLKVAQIANGISAFPLYVALEKNFFKAQGLTLVPPIPPQMGSGSKLATTIEAGGAEVGVGGITDVFMISKVDTSIRIIGAFSNAFLLDIVVSKSFEQKAHLAATSPLADKIKALVGKKIGISAPGSAPDMLVTYLFRQQGLDAQKDAIKVNLSAAIPSQLAALQSGRVDAVAVLVPGGEEAEMQGFGDIFISPVRGDVPDMQGQLFGVSYARKSVIDAKPRAVQAFIRAMAQAEDYIHKNPNQMTALLEKYLKLDKKVLNIAWNATKASVPLTPQVSQQAYNTADQFHVKAGLIAMAPDYKELVATDTINKALSGMTGL